MAKRATKIALASFSLAAIAGCSVVYDTWSTYYSDGPGEFAKNAFGFSAVTCLILLIGPPIWAIAESLKAILSRKPLNKDTWSDALIIPLVVIVTLFAAFRISGKVEVSGLVEIATRGNKLVQAVRQFESKHGNPPERVEELIPEFLPGIPGTYVSKYPRFEFVRNTNSPTEFASNSWIIKVTCTNEEFLRQYLVYLPNQQYPARTSTFRTKRIRDWALIETDSDLSKLTQK